MGVIGIAKLKKEYGILFFCLIISNVVFSQCVGEMTSASNGLKVTCPEEKYILVFHDEFNDDELDKEKWHTKGTAPPPADRTIWHNCKKEHQVYLEDNVSLLNGLLRLTAKEEDYTYTGISEGNISCKNESSIVYEVGDVFEEEFSFTSGMILGKEAYHPLDHLIFESRIKIPKGKGLWPAFWTWHHDEIDIFEYFNTEEDDHFQTNHHYADGGMCPQRVYRENLTENFHVYKIEITPWFIKWYFDEEVVRTVSKFYTTIGQAATVECGQVLPASSYVRNSIFPDMEERWFTPFINLAINQNFDKNEISGIPAFMDVDYIRVYKRLPTNSEKNKCYYEIKGETEICEGEELVFKLDSNIELNEVDWFVSGNLKIMELATDEIRVMISPNVTGEDEGVIEADIKGRNQYCPDNLVSLELKLNPGTPDVFTIIEDKMTCLGGFGFGKYSTNPLTDVFWEVYSGAVETHVFDGDYTLVEPSSIGEFMLLATATNRCGGYREVTNVFEVEECEKEVISLVSPNPADDILNVEFGNTFLGSEFGVSIFNTNSELRFYKTTEDDKIEIDVSGLGNGMYFLQVITGSNAGYSTFVVSH